MASRGADLESAVNRCNLYYRKNKIALIEKKPTPVELTKVGAILKQSTVDYVGIIPPLGTGIAFDAKMTQSKTSFPLSNVHDHQVIFLEYWEAMGGIATFLIWFYNVDPDEAFWTPAGFLKSWYDKAYIEETGRKSIPYKEFDQNWKVPINDYLSKIIKTN